MTPQPTPSPPDPEWEQRLRYWRRKLGRVRLGAEPVEEQLARYRRVTWLLTALPAGIGAFFVALFEAFGRPDVGLVLAAVLFVPLVAVAWLDYALLRSRVSAYLRELRAYHDRGRVETRTPGGG